MHPSSWNLGGRSFDCVLDDDDKVSLTGCTHKAANLKPFSKPCAAPHAFTGWTTNVFLNHEPESQPYTWKECHKQKIATVPFTVFHKVIFFRGRFSS